MKIFLESSNNAINKENVNKDERFVLHINVTWVDKTDRRMDDYPLRKSSRENLKIKKMQISKSRSRENEILLEN